ncbi:unnamed protein product [Thlaspi arvense]|uniref:Non-haem dioxygenase N-terminal domain-containing protein n=1 Tax=Thlaspi arvense TaxID=13288 RepID=A0AAU9SS03_THLAR|nr:unnamed protein product [Thlaspi arvense]
MPIICVTTSSAEKEHEPKQDLDNDQSPPLNSNPFLPNLQSQIPNQFIWPDEEKPSIDTPELNVPLLDLWTQVSTPDASTLIAEACTKHGFFLVINHGVSESLISDAQRFMERFFDMPLIEKQRAKRKLGESYGYACSFTGRFSTKLPWKETLSFRFSNENSGSRTVQDYFSVTLGQEFERFGKVFQDYCDAMSSLSLNIMELLGLSLGVNREYFRGFFEENDSIMRLNHYPLCAQPDLTLVAFKSLLTINGDPFSPFPMPSSSISVTLSW